MPRERVPTGESLVVLTRDEALAGTLRALGSEHPIVTVNAELDLAGELLGKQPGVAIVDAAAASTAVERLTSDLKTQFPDVVLIVAGTSRDQNALAKQISNGTVYRFLHKPASEQRVRLFVDAAWRRHGEQLSGLGDAIASQEAIRDHGASRPANAWLIGGVVLSALVFGGGWLITRKPTDAPVPNSVSAPAAPAPRDEQLESLLSRADAALAAGALVAPPGSNAAELYQQAIHRNSGDPRPTAGIETVIGELLSAAESQLSAQHFDEAQRLAGQARAIRPDHVRVAFLSAQIGKQRERAVQARARQESERKKLEEQAAALRTPDSAVAPAPVEAEALAESHTAEISEAGSGGTDSGAVTQNAAKPPANVAPTAKFVPAANLELAK